MRRRRVKKRSVFGFNSELYRLYRNSNLQSGSVATGPQTVTTGVYLQILNEFFDQLTDDELTTGYYQQDGATCHTSNEKLREIERFFFFKTELSQKTFSHPDLLI